MKNSTIVIFIIFSLATLALSAGARDVGQDEALRLRQAGNIIALETLITMINQRYPHSSLLEVELEDEDSVYIYEVELITADGSVRDIEIDARTGKIIKDEEDD